MTMADNTVVAYVLYIHKTSNLYMLRNNRYNGGC